jgi:hypothetical protein
VHSDIQAELLAIRTKTIEEALDLRVLEVARLDAMLAGLWPGIQEGSAANVSAGVRVSERRAKLLGLDAPTTTKTELAGSLSVTAETRVKAEVEDLERWLTFEELRELGAESERLFAAARALVQARSGRVLLPVPSSIAIHADRGGDPTQVDPLGSADAARLVLDAVETLEDGDSHGSGDTTTGLDETGGK